MQRAWRTESDLGAVENVTHALADPSLQATGPETYRGNFALRVRAISSTFHAPETRVIPLLQNHLDTISVAGHLGANARKPFGRRHITGSFVLASFDIVRIASRSRLRPALVRARNNESFLPASSFQGQPQPRFWEM